jgi:hypothetical protein
VRRGFLVCFWLVVLAAWVWNDVYRWLSIEDHANKSYNKLVGIDLSTNSLKNVSPRHCDLKPIRLFGPVA